MVNVCAFADGFATTSSPSSAKIANAVVVTLKRTLEFRAPAAFVMRVLPCEES